MGRSAGIMKPELQRARPGGKVGESSGFPLRTHKGGHYQQDAVCAFLLGEQCMGSVVFTWNGRETVSHGAHETGFSALVSTIEGATEAQVQRGKEG